jgi:putative nucleotidyltransferase with HDIG domain
MRRILFVDDEPNVLKGLRRMLRGMRKEWEMHFVASGAEALEALAASPFDVIVSDMRMPGMDGVELLSQVRQHYPDMVRLVLSAYADHKAIMRSVRLAHQYISKPCDAETLKQTIERAFALKTQLANKDLRLLISKLATIPGLPATYGRVSALLRDSDASVQEVGRVIGEDVGMTVKILQLVNSAFYGLARPVTSSEEAAVYLGIDTLRTLVLTFGVVASFEESHIPDKEIEALYHHSLNTGTLAKAIAEREGFAKDQVEEAFMAGMLHDLGKLVMVHNMPKSYGRLLRATLDRNLPIHAAETEIFGATHEQIGAYLIRLWGLPDAIAEAVAFHHAPHLFPGTGFNPVGVVHVADALVHREVSLSTDEHHTRLSAVYLTQLGLVDRLAEWADLVQPALDNNNESQVSSAQGDPKDAAA